MISIGDIVQVTHLGSETEYPEPILYGPHLVRVTDFTNYPGWDFLGLPIDLGKPLTNWEAVPGIPLYYRYTDLAPLPAVTEETIRDCRSSLKSILGELHDAEECSASGS